MLPSSFTSTAEIDCLAAKKLDLIQTVLRFYFLEFLSNDDDEMKIFVFVFCC